MAVDFYFTLSFLFTCGEAYDAYPHYATCSQKIVVEFDFNNPLAYLNTLTIVDPKVIDPHDITTGDRYFINRISPYALFNINLPSNHYVLFYNKFVWIPALINIIAGYKYYNWITRNYERITKIVAVNNGANSNLYTFVKALYYTQIMAFFTNAETVKIINTKGMPDSVIPFYTNRYKLALFDVMTYQF
jgi:hypothetical protein